MFMKKDKLSVKWAIMITLYLFLSFPSIGQNQETLKVGFLIHDLVADRWQKDMNYFEERVKELKGEVIAKNCLGDANLQVQYGKEMIDEGIKVITVVPENGVVLGELVQYAHEHNAKIIAYDRIILNSDLDYYISFSSEKVGEMMAEYAIERKPKGNYVLINGPSSDNNSLLIKKGLMKVLTPHIESGDIDLVFDGEADAWYSLNSMMVMQTFLMEYDGKVDVVLTGSDDLSIGAIEAIGEDNVGDMIITGQDANRDACLSILKGFQTMTIYKSLKKTAYAAAEVAVDLTKGKPIKTTGTVNNGKIDVPAVLFDPEIVDKTNMDHLIEEGHFSKEDLDISE